MRTAQTPRERLIDDEAYEEQEVRECGSTETYLCLLFYPEHDPTHTAVPPARDNTMTRRHGPGCSAELSLCASRP